MPRRRKKSIPKRILTLLKKGSLHFSLSPSPISFSIPLDKLGQNKRARKAKVPLLIPSEIIPANKNYQLAVRDPQTNVNPIQREALPMIAQKIAEAKAMGRNDLVLSWSVIEYWVRYPRKAKRTLKEVLYTLSGY